MCDTFQNQNFDIYLKHEKMLEFEREQRVLISEQFQTKMKELNDQLNIQKEHRQKEYEINNGLREKISKAIEDYQTKE